MEKYLNLTGLEQYHDLVLSLIDTIEEVTAAALVDLEERKADKEDTPTIMGASGANHKSGLVPDTSSTAGTSKYLREDATWVAQATSSDIANLQPPAGELDPQGWEAEIAKKEDKLEIVAAVNVSDAALSVTSLVCEIGKYYRLDVPVETLNVMLPAMANETLVKAVVLYLTGGTTPAVTISSTAVSGGVAPDVHFQNWYRIDTGKTYEVSCVWNGASWIIASVTVNVV